MLTSGHVQPAAERHRKGMLGRLLINRAPTGDNRIRQVRVSVGLGSTEQKFSERDDSLHRNFDHRSDQVSEHVGVIPVGPYGNDPDRRWERRCDDRSPGGASITLEIALEAEVFTHVELKTAPATVERLAL